MPRPSVPTPPGLDEQGNPVDTNEATPPTQL
jgi:hypothetical protein